MKIIKDNSMKTFNVGECIIINSRVNVYDGIEWIDIKSKPFEIIRFLLSNEIKYGRITDEKYDELSDYLGIVESALTYQ